MKLCIPILYKKETYTDIEITKPKAGVIADTQEEFQEKTPYHGIHKLISGSVVSISNEEGKTIDNRAEIITATKQLAYQAAEQVGLQIMLSINKNDKIETMNECPRCGHKYVSEDDGFLKDLPVVYLEEYAVLHFDLEDPIQIKNKATEEILHDISSFDMRYPTLNDCIDGTLRARSPGAIKGQYAIYAAAIVNINTELVDMKWKKTWGEWFVNNLSFDSLRGIGRAMQKYGYDMSIDEICIKCKKEFKSSVDTSSFFESGLQPE